MYHTEGYLDKQTYFTKGHIFKFAIAQGKSLCYFWCVLEKGLSGGEREFEARLKKWFLQELVVQLEKGGVYIQKELNRFGNCLFKCREHYGVQEEPFLCVYFRGQVYACGGDERVGFGRFKGHKGVYLSPSLRSVKAIMECVEKEISLEEKGNRFKACMLRAMSEGELECGYFFLWEDGNDF